MPYDSLSVTMSPSSVFVIFIMGVLVASDPRQRSEGDKEDVNEGERQWGGKGEEREKERMRMRDRESRE